MVHSDTKIHLNIFNFFIYMYDKSVTEKKRMIANYTMSLFRQSEAESMTVFALKLSRLTFDRLVFNCIPVPC